MNQDIQAILFDEERIRHRVKELGRAITEDLRGEDFVILALLKGSVVFVADLIRSVECPMKVDFAWISSYGKGTVSSGDVQLKVFPDDDLSDKTVVIVDDILDTGRTLSAVVKKLREQCRVRQVKTCVLLDKAARRVVPVEADYAGFRVDDVFVVGYGLDYADRYRNLPYIGVLKAACYSGEDSP